MTVTNSSVDNGVNVEALLDARAALTETPAAAQFKWRATCKWVKGTHSHSTIKSFFGLGEEQSHRTEYSFDADHPIRPNKFGPTKNHRSPVGSNSFDQQVLSETTRTPCAKRHQA